MGYSRNITEQLSRKNSFSIFTMKLIIEYKIYCKLHGFKHLRAFPQPPKARGGHIPQNLAIL